MPASRHHDDAITTAIHLTLSHLEKKNTYARMLFIGFSSAFNTLTPHREPQPARCRFPAQLDPGLAETERSQTVCISSRISSSITLSAGVPQGCVLGPLRFSWLTHDCVATCSTNSIANVVGDTTVMGLAGDGDETASRIETQ